MREISNVTHESEAYTKLGYKQTLGLVGQHHPPLEDGGENDDTYAFSVMIKMKLGEPTYSTKIRQFVSLELRIKSGWRCLIELAASLQIAVMNQ